MREIKFRAWSKNKKAFIAGFNMVNFHSYYNAGLEPHIYRYSSEWKLSEIELMQFTGLFDKNGKEAYYGDIIKHSTTEGGIFRRTISWDDELQCTMIDNMPYYRLHESGYIQPSKLEFIIIGNIYENPELLTP